MYFDINTGDTVPVCAKPDCMHDNDECNACLNTCVIYNIYYYNEYIYYMPIFNGMANLCRMDKSGSTTKILGELFPSDGSSSIHLAFLGDYAYAYDSGSHLGLDTEFTEKIVEVSLKNGERNEIYDVTGVSLAIKNVKGFGDGLYFNVQHSERSDENISISSYGLYMYSQSEKNVSQISTENINDYYLSDNYLYYFINRQGLYKSDIENQKTELIYKSNKAVDMCNISYDGRYLYISNGKYCDYLRKVLGNKEKKYIVIDTDGKVINEISCADSLEMLFGDDRYLFCMGMGEDQLMYMDKREIEAKITLKKEEIKNLISQDKLEDAKNARKEMQELQEKYDLLDEMEKEEGDGVKNQAAAGKVNEIKGKKNVVSALVNALRAGFKKKPVAKEDMEVLDAMIEGSDEDGGLTVPADISTTIRTLRRSEDALETIVRTERTTKVKGSRVYEVNADSVPFDTVDEESQFPDVATPVLKKVEYVIKKFGGILKATYELLEDSDENIISYLENWIARKVKATRNALIIKKLDEMTDGFEIEATSVDDLKNIFNVELDPALVAGSKALTNQSGFNWLDKLKDKEGNYILQKDVTNPSKRLLFGTYPVVVMSNKTIKNEATGKVPIYCGNFEEAITLFDREKLTIGISTEAGDLWSKDQTGIKVRERLDCQIVDDMAVYKAEIPADQISEPTKKYRRSELEAMTVDEIKQLATTKSYTITKTKKDEIIEEFITAQKG